MLPENKSNINRPWWLLVLLLLILYYLTAFITEGMFFDGLTYSSISRNLSAGIGEFWKPVYQDATFYEHPPFIFWLQSVFFNFLGDGFYTEKIFSAVVLAITVFGLLKIWHLLFRTDAETRLLNWLPVLCWCIIPCAMFAYVNNLLDTSMALFDLWAFYFFLRSIYHHRQKWFMLTLCGLFIFLAIFAKGPVGAFPLALPVLYFIVFERNKLRKSIFSTLYIWLIAGFCFFMLMQYPPAKTFFTQYFQQQVIGSMEGRREKVDSIVGNLQIFVWLFNYLLPTLLLCFLGWIFLKKRKKQNLFSENQYLKVFYFLLLVALSASVPIAFSPKQRAFYLVPSFLFYALALSVLLIPATKELVYKTDFWRKYQSKFNKYGYILLALSFIYCAFIFGKPGRDHADLHDVKILQNTIPFGTQITICENLYYDWRLKAYLERYSHIYTSGKMLQTRYYLFDAEKCSAADTATLTENGFYKANLPLKRLQLYQKKIRIF